MTVNRKKSKVFVFRSAIVAFSVLFSIFVFWRGVQIPERATLKAARNAARPTNVLSPTDAPIVEEQKPASRECHYEEAVGHFDFGNDDLDGGGGWSWETEDKETCPVKDYLHYLSALPSSSYQGNHSPSVVKSPHLHFIIIGDSLDRQMVHGFSSRLNKERDEINKISKHNDTMPILERIKVYDKVHHSTAHYVNEGKRPYNIDAQYTDYTTMTISHFKIFGMRKTCQIDSAKQLDSRYLDYNTTSERIQKLLRNDLFSPSLPSSVINSSSTEVIVMIGSCLWDLSANCNDQPTMDPGFLHDYGQGIRENYKVLKEELGFQYIFWRTCPPVTQSYSTTSTEGGHGRNRSNQQALNKHLRELVHSENLGIVVDWWEMISGHVPESKINMPDGRHYGESPSMAFFNLFLTTVFSYYPHLLGSR